jgi:hypothetical protein
MRILFFILLPFLVFAQDSWVEIEFQFDNYAEEVSWSLYNAEDTISVSEGYYESQQPNAYQFIELDSGDYTFELMDAWGDGLSWPQDGYCLVSNECQDTLFYASGNYGLGLIESLTIAPCAPPEPAVIDCMDENATNYNPDADVNDQFLCEYPPCEGWGDPFVDQICDGGQALLYWNWEASDNPNCNVIQITYSGENTNVYNFDVDIDNGIWGVYTGNGQMPPNWEEEYSFQAMFADSTMSDTLFHTPYPCTQGCTDDDAPNYNPWATVDDGSCGGQACDAGYTSITIDITLDNWPSETGWSLISGGVIDEHIDGDYNYQDIGQTFSYSYCVMEAGFEFIISDTYGDGLAGSTTGGSLDGDVLIRGCNGDTITQLSSGTWLNAAQENVGVGFGSVAYSGWQQATICETDDIAGCTDPAYQEFNSSATIDDGSCLTEHIYGCIDENAFNYDDSATAMDIYPNCNYELWIGDAAADGWGNSFLGVVQGDNQWTFTMGPGEYEQTFPIWLETDKPVKIFYFEVGGAQTPPEEVAFQTLHNSFKLTNADDVILMYEGWNPFADNGQGALQAFEPPFFQTYNAMPFCGTLCIPTVEGCLDVTALNYNEEANTDDGSCIEIIEGCTNELAFNYDEEANYDDDSCEAVVVGCMDTIAWNYNEDANTDGGDCIYLGCTDIAACNYNANANADSGGCTYPDDYYNCSDVCINDADADGVCDELEILGCTSVAAINYNPEATDNDGSCVGIVYGCTDPVAFNYDETANTDNGSCVPVTFGCTNSSALNYDALANTDNGSCITIVYGCTDSAALNYNENANVEDGSCIDVVYGCTDNTALNYNELANTDNGSCITIVYGCTDPNALNYDELANVDDFSCIDPVYGCTDPNSFNYNELANVDNESCIDFVYGCIDSDAFNYDASANTLDPNVPCCYVSGCTDSAALNYNINACYDDGSCIEVIEGCADPNAYNYNPLVNLPDNSTCLYDAGCYSGPGEPYWLNDPCYAWVIDVDGYCCTEIWDDTCQSMYNYCEDGWPVGIDELSGSDIVVYPNPTANTFTIETRLDIDVELYNIVGELIKVDNIKRIDISDYPDGMYNLIITYDKIRITKKIIKL